MKKTILAAMLMGLATNMGGCAMGKPIMFEKNGASTQDFDKDNAQCQYEAQVAVRQPNAVSRDSLVAEYDMMLQRRDLSMYCLKARGWSVQQH